MNYKSSIKPNYAYLFIYLFVYFIYLFIYFPAPPEVDQTNHAVISKDKYVGTSCELACIVLASPDVETIVTWHRNKAEIKFPSGKYSTRVEETSEDKTFRYVLKVHDLQLSDIGQYACRVQSQFNMEDQGIASIKFQNEEKGMVIWS